jgi:hypothetical protein
VRLLRKSGRALITLNKVSQEGEEEKAASTNTISKNGGRGTAGSWLILFVHRGQPLLHRQVSSEGEIQRGSAVGGRLCRRELLSRGSQALILERRFRRRGEAGSLVPKPLNLGMCHRR